MQIVRRLHPPLGHQQFRRDHEQCQPAHQLEVRQPHQRRDDTREDNAQDDGDTGARSCPKPLAGSSPRHASAITSALSPDNSTLIPNDLADRDPKGRRCIST